MNKFILISLMDIYKASKNAHDLLVSADTLDNWLIAGTLMNKAVSLMAVMKLTLPDDEDFSLVNEIISSFTLFEEEFFEEILDRRAVQHVDLYFVDFESLYKRLS